MKTGFIISYWNEFMGSKFRYFITNYKAPKAISGAICKEFRLEKNTDCLCLRDLIKQKCANVGMPLRVRYSHRRLRRFGNSSCSVSCSCGPTVHHQRISFSSGNSWFRFVHHSQPPITLVFPASPMPCACSHDGVSVRRGRLG